MISLPRIFKALEANLKESILIPSAPIPTTSNITSPAPEEGRQAEDASPSSPASVNQTVLTKELRMQVLQAAQREANQIIADASAKAQAIEQQAIAKAQEEARQIKEQAFAQGYAEGKEKATHQLQKGLDDITALLDRIDDNQRKIIDETEEGIRLLVVDIVRKIMGKVLKEDDKALVYIVERALASYKNTDWVKITVSETDAQTSCITDKAMLASLLDLSGSIEVEVIPDGASGLCIVETPDGIADASVETQLCNLKSILTKG